MTTAAAGLDRLQSYLRQHGVCFTLRHHAYASGAQEVAATEHVSGDSVAKPVVAVADGRMVMVVVPASCVVLTSKLAGALGAAHVELAHEADLASVFADCEVGALSPFGNLYGLDVYVDQRLGRSRHMEIRAGTHTESIGITYADFERLVKPTVVDVARPRDDGERWR